MDTNIGTPEQWAPIFQRSPGLDHALNELIDLTGGCAVSLPLPSLAHEVVFALRNVCIEECWEVLLLAANQYQSGAQKLIRALYERALTIAYLGKYPEKAQRFIDYAAIQRHRVLGPAIRLFGEDVLNERITPSGIAEIKSAYEEAKPAFQITKCKQCGSKQLVHVWDLDITSMADKVQQGFPELLLPAYTLPTLALHTTATSAFSRVSLTDGRIIFNYALPHAGVDQYVCLALQVILMMHKASAAFLLAPESTRLLPFETAFHTYVEQTVSTEAQQTSHA